MAHNHVNTHEIIGNLGTSPELKSFSDGTKIATFRIATERRWRDKNTKELVSRTEWHDVVVKGAMAEAVVQHWEKGALVRVVGEVRTRKYQDKSGNDRYVTQTIVDGMGGQAAILAGRKGDGEASVKPRKNDDDRSRYGDAAPDTDLNDEIPF